MFGRCGGSAFQVQLLCNTTLFCAASFIPSSGGKRFLGSGGAGKKARERSPREGWKEMAVLSVSASRFNSAALAMTPRHPPR